MKANPKIRGRIPAEELTSVKPWAFPSMEPGRVPEVPFVSRSALSTGGDPRRAKDQQEPVKPPTVRELEGIRQLAYDEGLQAGRDEGHQEGYQAGHQAGREAGLKEGHAEGMAQAAAEIRAQSARLAQLTAQLQAPLQAQEQELESVLLRLVMDLCRATLKAELKLAPEHLSSALQEVMAALPQAEEPITLRVHPDDESLLRQACQAHGANWQIRPDPKIAPGGLVAKSSNSYLEYTHEGRFQAICEQLLARRLADAEPS